MRLSYGFCKLQSWGFVPGEEQIKLDRLSLHTAASCDPIWLVSREFVLMQDNDPKHTSKFCQRCIKSKEEHHVLQLMSWSAQSADLNHIELVWDDRKGRAKQATSTAYPWQIFQESWAELSSVFLQSLVERMPKWLPFAGIYCEAIDTDKRESFW